MAVKVDSQIKLMINAFCLSISGNMPGVSSYLCE